MSKFENPNKLFPLFFTTRLEAVKAFYVEQLGWSVTFDMPNYLQVRRDAEDGPELAFMVPEKGNREFSGEGVTVSVPVPDADAYFAVLGDRKVDCQSDVSLKPWGWRSFHVADPIGVVLDFFHVAAAPPQAAMA